MSTENRADAPRKAKNSNIFPTMAIGAITGFLCFLLLNKLITAVGVALVWFGPYSLTHITPEDFLGIGFGIAWALKKPTPLKATVWQTTILVTIWILMIGVAAVFGDDSKWEDLWHGLVSLVLEGALSGFVTAWVMPYVLKWASTSNQRPIPPSSLASSQDVTYEIKA